MHLPYLSESPHTLLRHSVALTILALWSMGCGGGDGERIDLDEPDLPVVLCPEPGDTSDPDTDGDGVIDRCDNCPQQVNPDQSDADYNGFGDVCDDDDDGDGLVDEADNCPGVLQEQSQTDADGDGLGDACDPCPAGEDQNDADADGFHNCEDLCPGDPMAGDPAADADGDGIGDGCDNCPDTPNQNQLDLDGNGTGDACEVPPEMFQWEEASAASIQAAILDGRTNCAEVVGGYIGRIQRYDLDISDGPPINAFTTLNDQVLDQARALDAHVAETGELVGPMHCMPIVLKDIYNAVEMPISSGSLSMVGTQPTQDATVVAAMREQGALFLGGTTMDEFSRGINGISSRSGRTGKAYDPSRSPGGSSAGSGAAVGANFAVGGTGTDNCASLTVPAAYNGLVTLRPTLGLVSMFGIFPSNYLDAVAGPIARSIPDMARMLDAMAGEDPNDSRTSGARRPDNYMDHLDPEGLKGKRIGVLRRYGKNTQEEPTFSFRGSDLHTLSVYKQVFAEMEAQGATIIDNVTLPNLDTRRSGAGFIGEADYYLGELTEGPHDVFRDVCEDGAYSKFAHESQQACLDYVEWAYENSTVGSDRQRSNARRYVDNAEYIHSVMDVLDLDGIILPVDGIGAVGTNYYSRTHCVITSVSGTPSIVMLAGYSDDATPLPIGMMIIGRKFSDATLVEMAYAYEHATQKRRPPKLTTAIAAEDVPTIDFNEFYDFRLELGQRSWERYLKDGSKFSLTTAAFTEIVRETAQDRDQQWLLGE